MKWRGLTVYASIALEHDLSAWTLKANSGLSFKSPGQPIEVHLRTGKPRLAQTLADTKVQFNLACLIPKNKSFMP